MRVLGSRVDGLTLAYRVSLNPAFVDKLRERMRIANKHGRAGFEWLDAMPVGEGGALPVGGGTRTRRDGHVPRHLHSLHGELRFSDRSSCWHITNQPYFRMQVTPHAPGAVDRFEPRRSPQGVETLERVVEGGWTIEVVFYAQWLAELGLDAALREGEALASLCGEVHETRLRRIDLCADVEGWSIKEDDVRRLVKRPRARWQKEYGGVVGVDARGRVASLKKPKSGRASKEEREEEERAQDYGRGALARRQITGLSVGRGGAMMTRIYDKRVELERDEERRKNEEARWTAMGWDGDTNVTRVEFQVRGSVVSEFGLRDPWSAKDVEWGRNDKGRPCVVAQRDAVDADGVVLGLVDRLDWLWRSCLEWVKLVELDYTKSGRLKPVGQLDDDARWALLRTVTFAASRAPSTIKRFRVRSAASAAMGLGVALAQAGRDGELEPLPENSGAYDEATARDELVARVQKLKADEALKIVEMLLTHHGGAVGASVHFAVRSNAALLRFKERRASADLSTGPPHGDGARPPPLARGGGHDSTGDSQASWAFA